MTWWVTLLLFQAQGADLPQRNPYTSAADIAQGKRLYAGRCAGCHGPAGEGGKGANLAVPALPRAAEDAALFRIIRSGIPDTEMPGSLMDVHEIWQTAAFVRTLGKVDAAPVKGNAAAGAAIFRGKGGCDGCHTIGNEGGRQGPALTQIAMRRSAAHIRAKILDPAKDVPERYRTVALTLKNGRTVNGVLLNEDTYSVQVRDFGDRLHSYWKDELAKFVSERKTTMPPSRGRLTDTELDDLVAFLMTQRGAK